MRASIAAALILVGIGSVAPDPGDAGAAELALDMDRLEVEGSLSVALRDAALLTLGGARGTLHAKELDLEIYAEQHITLNTHVAGGRNTRWLPPEVRHYTDATVTFELHEEGHAYASGAETVLVAEGIHLLEGAFFGSASQWEQPTHPMRYDRREGPLLGLKQDPERIFDARVHVRDGPGGVPTVHRVAPDLPEATLGDLALRAPSLLTLNGTTLRIDHAGGSETFEARDDAVGAGLVEHRITRRLILSPRGAELAIDARDAATIVIAERGSLHVEGRATMRGASGSVVSEGLRHQLAQGDLAATGGLTLDVAPAGTGSFLDKERPRLEVVGEAPSASLLWEGEALERRGVRPQAPSPSLVEALLAIGVVAWSILSRGLLPLRVRDPLSHPARVKILAALKARGVLDRRALQGETGLGRGTLLYHLGVLERTGLLAAFTWGDRAVYHLAVGPLTPDDARRLAVLTSPAAQALASALVENGPLARSELAARSGLHASTVSRLVRRLRACGLVEVGPDRVCKASTLLEEWARSQRDGAPEGAR